MPQELHPPLKSPQTTRDAGSLFYHPELDVLRFFAFLAVFIHHGLPGEIAPYINAGVSQLQASWLITIKNAGSYGVDLFFTLSAYLITELLIREHRKNHTINVKAFYIRRALRIWPLYFTFLAITILIVPRLLPADSFGSHYAVAFTLLAGNWACVLYGLPVSVASPLWSVSIEEQFYLAWPLLLFFFGIGRIQRIAIILLAIATITRVILATLEVTHPSTWCNTFARLDPIALGALLALWLRGGAPSLHFVWRGVLVLVGMAFWLIATRYLSQEGWSSLASYPLVAVGSVLIVFASLKTIKSRLPRAPLSGLVYLGRISYGLYVFHVLALALVNRVLVIPILNIQVNFERRFILAFVLTVALAAVSYRWLEKPFLRLKDRFTYVPSGASAELALRTESSVGVARQVNDSDAFEESTEPTLNDKGLSQPARVASPETTYP